MTSPDSAPHQPFSAETATPPEANFEPTPEGVGSAIDDALVQHQDAIVHEEAARHDGIGITGGDKLRLYPNPRDPREVITIGPVGKNADERRFPATQGLHVNFSSKRAPGSGTYRVYGVSGERSVQQWAPNPELAGTIAVNGNPDEAAYAGLIDAIGRGSTERSAGRTKRAAHALGRLARSKSDV